jgi:hypothetical protein
MRPVVAGTIFAWLFLGIWCAPARSDGGSIRLSGKKGGYQITVFTAPTPFRAGAVDVSALVQDISTGELMSQVQVTIRMIKSGRIAFELPATPEGATNKLFRAAQFELPEPGRWEMQVRVDGSHGEAVIGGEVDAAERLPRWREMWLWIGWPALAIALFGIHLGLERQRKRSPAERGKR